MTSVAPSAPSRLRDRQADARAAAGDDGDLFRLQRVAACTSIIRRTRMSPAWRPLCHASRVDGAYYRAMRVATRGCPAVAVAPASRRRAASAAALRAERVLTRAPPRGTATAPRQRRARATTARCRRCRSCSSRSARPAPMTRAAYEFAGAASRGAQAHAVLLRLRAQRARQQRGLLRRGPRRRTAVREWSPHGIGCGICIDVALLAAMRCTASGATVADDPRARSSRSTGPSIRPARRRRIRHERAIRPGRSAHEAFCRSLRAAVRVGPRRRLHRHASPATASRDARRQPASQADVRLRASRPPTSDVRPFDARALRRSAGARRLPRAARSATARSPTTCCGCGAPTARRCGSRSRRTPSAARDGLRVEALDARRQRAQAARGSGARSLPPAAAGREAGGARPDDFRRRARAEQPARDDPHLGRAPVAAAGRRPDAPRPRHHPQRVGARRARSSATC